MANRIRTRAANGKVENPADHPAPARFEKPKHDNGLLKRGGVNEGGGRPPNEWKRLMAELAGRRARAAETKRVLEDPNHPQWMNAWRFAAEQAHGKPQQSNRGGRQANRCYGSVNDRPFPK